MTATSSSYRLGVKPSACHEIFPKEMTVALQDAVINHFEKRQMPGFLCEDGLLHGVEMRTSSPVRVCRGGDMKALGVNNLYPVGEGAGFAGGIVSAAVDGIVTADVINNELNQNVGSEIEKSSTKRKNIGFDY